jgi:hypothetical protein
VGAAAEEARSVMSTAPDVPDDTPLAHALNYATAGIRVLPIKPGQKRPPMASWQHAATTDPKIIGNWYRGLYGDHGVGLAMGTQPNGRNLFALDVDEHDPAQSGSDTLAELEAIHGKLPDTVRSITGAGGAHHIYDSGDVVVTNGAAGAIGPGLDVRGAGGQIVVAPTIHPNGTAYTWEHGYAPDEHPIAPAPAWLLAMVVPEIASPMSDSMPMTDEEWEPFARAVGINIIPTPADQLRDTWDWPTELAQRGWQLARTGRDGTHWTRPGKDPREGTSAVLHPGGPFNVFTTDGSVAPMWKAGKVGNGVVSLSPLAFVAAYDHGGDLRSAGMALRAATGHTATPPATVEPGVDPDADLRAMLIDWPTFWTVDRTEAEWLAEPVIAAHRSHAIFAPGGTGKSLLALWIASALATGSPIFGRRQQPRSVLYLDYEMTEDDLSERLENMGYGPDADLTNLHYALLPSLPGLDEPEGGKAVVRLAELCDAELVVIDTFGRAVHGDENEADTVRAWYRWTGIHLKAAGRAFVRVDHAGKDLEKGQRGTSAKNDDVDVVWRLTKADQNTFKLIAKKRRMGWVPETVDLLMREDDCLTYSMLAGKGWPAGTADFATVLDGLGCDLKVSVRAARQAVKEAEIVVSNEVLRAALKYRREALESVPAHPPAHLRHEGPRHTVRHAEAETENAQVDASRHTLRHTPAHLASPSDGTPLLLSSGTPRTDPQPDHSEELF